MPKDETKAFQKKFYNQFEKVTFSVECDMSMGNTWPVNKNVGLHALHIVQVISRVDKNHDFFKKSEKRFFFIQIGFFLFKSDLLIFMIFFIFMMFLCRGWPANTCKF